MPIKLHRYTQNTLKAFRKTKGELQMSAPQQNTLLLFLFLKQYFLFGCAPRVSIYILESRFGRLRHIVQRFLRLGRAREIDIDPDSFASLGDMLTVPDTPSTGIEIRRSVWRMFDSLNFHLVENCIH